MAQIADQTAPLPWTWLHHLEFRNAMRLRVFRSEITAEQRQASLEAWLSDLTALVWMHIEPDPQSLQAESEHLSNEYTERLGIRSLDILHVAAAKVLGCQQMLTYDHRQQALAKAAGLWLA